MKTRIDQSERITVTATVHDGTHTYTVTPQAGNFLQIKEIGLAFSSDFQANGRYRVRFRGNAVTNQGAALEEVQPLASTQTIPFDSGEAILEPGEDLEISFRDEGGTGAGDVQAQVIGTDITPEEMQSRRGS